MNSRVKSIGFALLVVFSAIGMVATAPAMAASVDSETTTTTTTSELTDGATVTKFNGSDTDQIATLQASYATTKPEIQIIDPATGATIETFTNASNPDYFTSTGGTGPYYFNTTFNESDFGNVPMASGVNKSVTVRMIDNSSLADPGSADMANITVYLENVDGRTILRGSAAAMDLESVGAGPFTLDLGVFGTKDIATYEESDVGVNGSGSTVTLDLTSEAGSTNTSVADRFSDGVSDSASSGDWILSQQLFVNDEPQKVFYEEAPDSVDSTDTYGVYKPSSDEIVTNIGDEYDSNSVDVRVIGNNAYGLTTRVLDFGVSGLTASIPFMGSLTMLGASLVLFGRTKRRSTEA